MSSFTKMAMLTMALALVATGCLTRQIPEKHRFLVVAKNDAPARVEHDGILRIGRVRVASGFERRNFVYQTGEKQLEDDFYNEFYVEPRVMLLSNTKNWLETSGLFSSVIAIDSLVRSSWLLESHVESIFIDVRGQGPAKAMLTIEFSLLDVREAEIGIAMSKKYRADVEASARTAPAFIEAWSEGLAEILGRLENDLAELVLP